MVPPALSLISNKSSHLSAFSFSVNAFLSFPPPCSPPNSLNFNGDLELIEDESLRSSREEPESPEILTSSTKPLDWELPNVPYDLPSPSSAERPNDLSLGIGADVEGGALRSRLSRPPKSRSIEGLAERL